MSAISPIIPIPLPDFAAEQAARPYEADAPVAGVGAATPARAVESEENRPPTEYQNAPDGYDFSRAARALLDASSQTRGTLDREADPLDAARIRDNRGIRELMQSFVEYDNSEAIRRFSSFLDGYLRYGAPFVDSGEDGVIANLRAQENAAYGALGASRAVYATREIRDGVSVAIDRWFVGLGVFTPEMLNYTSSDGFRFTPLSSSARAATRAAEVMATYDRVRIAAYLREMALLTPRDFMFYDPTGLGALGLDARRAFLRRMDEILLQEDIDARAAELRYVFDEQERIRLEELGLEEEARSRLDRLRDEINTYYGQLRYYNHPYKAGVISEALA